MTLSLSEYLLSDREYCSSWTVYVDNEKAYARSI